jgi:hypothetical protein
MGQSLTKDPVNPTLEDLGENLRYNDANAFIYLNIGTDTKGNLNKISIVELKPKSGTNSAICTLVRLLKWLIRHKNTNENTRVVFSGGFKKELDWDSYFKQFTRDNKTIDLGFSMYQGGMSVNLHTLIEKLELLCNGIIPIPKAPPMPTKKINTTNSIKLKTGKRNSEQEGILIEPIYSQVPPYKCQYHCDGKPEFDPHPAEQTFSLKPWSKKKESDVTLDPPVIITPSNKRSFNDVVGQAMSKRQAKKLRKTESIPLALPPPPPPPPPAAAPYEYRKGAMYKNKVDDYAKEAGFELFFGRKRKCKCNHKAELKYLMSL